jgi:hypothetical protein
MQKMEELLPGQSAVTRNRLVTLEDLREFQKELKTDLKIELIMAFKALIANQTQQPAKKWLKSWEVRKLLNLSPGTLQTLRDNGTIPFSKIGGIFYYDPSDIDKEIEKRKGLGRNRSGQFVNAKKVN